MKKRSHPKQSYSVDFPMMRGLVEMVAELEGQSLHLFLEKLFHSCNFMPQRMLVSMILEILRLICSLNKLINCSSKRIQQSCQGNKTSYLYQSEVLMIRVIPMSQLCCKIFLKKLGLSTLIPILMSDLWNKEKLILAHPLDLCLRILDFCQMEVSLSSLQTKEPPAQLPIVPIWSKKIVKYSGCKKW